MKSIFSLSVLSILICITSCKEKTKEEKSASPVVLEQAVRVQGIEVEYATDSTQMKGYIAFDENSNERRPGVLIIHEWWGHNDYVRERADMLAELGYTALAVDMYGDGKTAAHPEDAGKFAMSVMTNLPEAEARFNAALALLKAHETVNSDKIAAIGYCFGGSVALTMANSGSDLDAVAAFHSGVQLPVMPSNQLTASVLVCNGADDPFISPESVEAFKMAMDSIGATYQYISYPGVKHSFTSKAANENGEKFNLPLEYNEDADQQSWASLLSLFKEVF